MLLAASKCPDSHVTLACETFIHNRFLRSRGETQWYVKSHFIQNLISSVSIQRKLILLQKNKAEKTSCKAEINFPNNLKAGTPELGENTYPINLKGNTE